MNIPIIRHALPGDSLGIARVQVETWHTAYKGIISDSYLETLDIKQKTEKWHGGILKNSWDLVFVAIMDDEVIGFISGTSSRTKEEYDAEITAFYILDRYQGGGIGKMLFSRMIEEFRGKGYSSFYLWVFSKGPARGFYEYMGGKYIDEKVEEEGEIGFSEVSYGWKIL